MYYLSEVFMRRPPMGIVIQFHESPDEHQSPERQSKSYRLTM